VQDGTEGLVDWCMRGADVVYDLLAFVLAAVVALELGIVTIVHLVCPTYTENQVSKFHL
jgi:hypothetical protein